MKLKKVLAIQISQNESDIKKGEKLADQVGLSISMVIFIFSMHGGAQSDIKSKIENLGRCNIILSISPTHRLKIISETRGLPCQEINHIKKLLPQTTTIVSVWQIQKNVAGHKPI